MPNAIDTNKLCMGCMSMLENENKPCPKCGYDIQKNVSAPHQLKPYTILSGKYLVGRVLGEGGFGITYLGWDLNLDIKIAIKEYYPAGLVTRETTSTGTSTVTPFTGDKQEFYHTGLDKFVNEAKSLAKFYTLPGIVAVKDFFRENSTAYIVMEFVNGITLKQHLANSGGKLRPDEVFELMRPLMKSLSQIHAKGIIHRDISPDNIMLTNKGDVKLLDFGAARDFVTEGNKSLSVLLKPGYAPEEQYRTKGHQGPWTDVYALCATIYKMITGITPPESLERFSEDDLVHPSGLGIELSKEAENALLKGLAVFQKDRYQSINELYNDIYGATQWAKTELAYTDMQLEQKITENKASAATEHAVRTIFKGGWGKKKLDAPSSSVDTKKITGRTIELIICMVVHAIVLLAVIIRFGDNYFTSEIIPSVIINMVLIAILLFRGKKLSVAERIIHILIQSLIIFFFIYLMNAYLEDLEFVEFEAVDFFACFSPFVIVLLNTVYTVFEMIRYNRTHQSNSSKKKKYNFIAIIIGCGFFALVTAASIYSMSYTIEGIKDQKEVYERKKASGPSSSKNTPGVDSETVGNTSGNISNYSIVAQQGDWIYSAWKHNKEYLYKTRIDGKENIQLNSNKSVWINVVGDWIYYINYNNDKDSGIYKIRTDGTRETRLTKGTSYYLNVVGDWIYYIYGHDKNGDMESIYKIRTDGTQETKLKKGPCTDIIVAGDWIYYRNVSDNGTLYKIRTDGTQETRLNIQFSSCINVVGDWIYYSNLSDNGTLYKIRTDGKQETRLSSNSSSCINVVGDWIYYDNKSDNGALYKIRTDGTKNTKLNNEKSSHINTTGDWVYYMNEDSKDADFYKIRTDGTGRQKLGAGDSADSRKNVPTPKYGAAPPPGKYTDNNIAFDYPTDWIGSTNKEGYPLITGIQGGVKYQLSVLDITNDTSPDIYDYALSKLPVTPLPGGTGSVGSYQIGNYTGVATGCLYQNGSAEESISLYCITDGKKRVVFATWCFANSNSQHKDEVYQDIIKTFIIKK